MIKKTTFICVVIASLVMYNASRRIWKINVFGDYSEIESVLYEELYKNNICLSNR